MFAAEPKEKGKVLAVIPNYNGGELICQCIESLLKQTYRKTEIVVVDNASVDGSPDAIRKKFPKINIIETGYNAGWGIACNIGMKSAQSDYIALVNNDAILDPDCIKEMVTAIKKDKSYGSCASRILLLDQRDTVEVCGLVIYPDGSSCGRGRLGPADQFMKEEEVFCANDCCCLYKREMIDDIGDYDPDFFIYCDETDMGWKHQFAGWKCVYAPNAIAYHAHSRTAGSYSTFKAYYVERNRIFIAIKYLPFPMFLLSFPRSAYRYYYQWYLATFKQKGALSHYTKTHSLTSGVKILLKAHWDAFKKLRVMWKRRRALHKTRRISDKDIQTLFDRYGISTREMAGYE